MKKATNYKHYFLLVFLFIFSECTKENVHSADVQNATIANNTNMTNQLAGGSYLNVNDVGAKGNNSDDTKALQKALDSSSQLYIPKGVYIISAPLQKTKGSVDIVADPGAVIQLAPTFPRIANKFTGAFTFENLDSLHIDGLTIDGNRANLVNAGRDWTNYIMCVYVNNSSNIKITNCNAINGPSMAFSIRNSYNIEVSNCSMRNNMFHGIEFNFCTNAVAKSNKIYGIGNQGANIAIGGIGILGTGGRNIEILNNYIDSTSDTGTKTEGSNNVVFDGNVVENSGKDGIKFQDLVGDRWYSDVVTVYHAKIINNIVNQIYNGRTDGSTLIQVWNACDVVVSNNIITGGSKTGQEDGVEVWADKGVAKSITVTNNTILNTNRFIYLNASNAVISGNNCENKVTPRSQYNGIQADNSTNFQIFNNQFKRQGTTSINGSAMSFYHCSNFVVSQNTVKNGFTGLSALLNSSKNISFSNNSFDNFGSYFAWLSTDSNQAIDLLLMQNNIVSHVGMNGPIGWILEINTKKLMCKTLNLTGTNILGNGSNGDAGLTVQGGENIGSLVLTSLFCNGNAFYPTINQIKNCNNIIGWKSTAAPKSNFWNDSSMVYNIDRTSNVTGWRCIKSGTPGSWKTLLH